MNSSERKAHAEEEVEHEKIHEINRAVNDGLVGVARIDVTDDGFFCVKGGFEAAVVFGVAGAKRGSDTFGKINVPVEFVTVENFEFVAGAIGVGAFVEFEE